MKRPEQDLQRACVKYMRLQYPKVLAFHPANEGTKDPIRGAILKAMGVLPGLPDVMICRPFGPWVGIAIELKAPKGKSTPIQLQRHEELRAVGWVVWTDITTFDQFKSIVDDYLK